ALLSPAAFGNAIRVLHAVGGSTNAVIHLAAIAGRVGVDLPLAELARLGAGLPVLAAVQPSGDGLMQDFDAAGGLPALLRELSGLLGTGGAFAVVRGSLAPDGAVIKTSAATPGVLRHRGPAVVFHDYEDMRRRVEDPALPVTAGSVL